MGRNSTVDLFRTVDKILKIPQNACNLVRNAEKISVIKDVPYYDDPKGVCKADVYSMPSNDKNPVMLYIHGGGFVAGGKQYREGVSRWFAGEGFCVFNVNYGLCPDFVFPEPLAHLAHAINFIAESADKFNADPTRLVIAGDSAGAYYASMLAAVTCNLTARKLVSIKPELNIDALLLNCGLYDVKLAIKTRRIIGEKIFSEFTGIKNFNEYEYKDLCSPINLLSANFPPAFMTYAKYDIFCAGQTERMMLRMQEEGVYCEVFGSNNPIDNHIFSLGWRTPQAKKANLACLDFVSRYLKGEIRSHMQ